MPIPTPAQQTALRNALKDRAVSCIRLEDSSRRLLLTPCDFKVYVALLSFLNGSSGRCDPGLRAVAKKAGVAVSTAGDSTHRLRWGGWISWAEQLRPVHGAMRLCRLYSFAVQPPGLRPMIAPKGGRKKERGSGTALVVDKSPQLQAPVRSRQQQMELVAAWVAESQGAAAR